MSSWDLVRAGLSSLLRDDPTIDLVDVAAGGGHLAGLDVIVYLHTGNASQRPPDLRQLICSNGGVLFVLPPDHTLSAAEARAIGADGAVSVQADRAELVQAIRKVAANDRRPVLGAPPCLLSDRQLAFVELAAMGLSNQEIADRLDVSVNTVKATLRVSYERIGVNSRAKAAAWYHRDELHRHAP